MNTKTKQTIFTLSEKYYNVEQNGVDQNNWLGQINLLKRHI